MPGPALKSFCWERVNRSSGRSRALISTCSFRPYYPATTPMCFNCSSPSDLLERELWLAKTTSGGKIDLISNFEHGFLGLNVGEPTASVVGLVAVAGGGEARWRCRGSWNWTR